LPLTTQHRANFTGLSVITNEKIDFSAYNEKTPHRSIVRALGKSVEAAGIFEAGDPDMADGAIKIVIAPKI
jgi:hypothetical protein